MSNFYISVYMPSALFLELCTEWYGLYAKLHMLDCNMPNAMTIAMSFSMTTEQVGYLIIYMSITRLWLSILPLQEEIAIIPPGFQFISQSLRYFSMPAYQGKSQISVCRHMFQFVSRPVYFISRPAYFISWPACFITRPAYFISRPACYITRPAYFVFMPAYFISQVSGLRYISLLAHQVTKWYLESQVFQYAGIQGRTYIGPAGVTGHRVGVFLTLKILYIRSCTVIPNTYGHPVKNSLDTGAERISSLGLATS
jgi:hypothetical protein